MTISEIYNRVDSMTQQSSVNHDDLRFLNSAQITVDCEWDSLGELAHIIQDRIDYCRTITLN